MHYLSPNYVYPAKTDISYPMNNIFLPFCLPCKDKIPWYSVNVSDFPFSAKVLVSLASGTLWTSIRFQKSGEGGFRSELKRAVVNLPEQTNKTN